MTNVREKTKSVEITKRRNQSSVSLPYNYWFSFIQNRKSFQKLAYNCLDLFAHIRIELTNFRNLVCTAFHVNVVWYIEIINNTREGIIIFFTENKRERGDWGANPSPGCRAKR